MFLPIRADRNHLRTLRRRILPQLVEQIHTVHVGHHDIQEQNVRLFRLELGQRFKPITCLAAAGHIGLQLQCILQQVILDGIVLCDQHSDLRVFIHTAHSLFRAARQKARAPDVLHNPPHGARLHRIFPQENKKTASPLLRIADCPAGLRVPASGLQHRNGNP